MQRRHFLAAAAAAPLASRAQSAWPSQPVKLLVAFPAGEKWITVSNVNRLVLRGDEAGGFLILSGL